MLKINQMFFIIIILRYIIVILIKTYILIKHTIMVINCDYTLR